MSEPQKEETLVEIIVPPGYREAERLDVYLTRFLPNASRAKVQRGVKDGRVTVEGKVETRVSRPVQPGETIVCRILRPPPMEILPEDLPLDIVYEDESLIIVNKAAGMVVHPAYGNRTGTLVNALLHHVGAGSLTMADAASDDSDGDEVGDDDGDVELDAGAADEAALPIAEGLSAINAVPRFHGDPAIRPGIVHRLDKDTSGLMVIAKNDEAHRRLAKQFADRSIRRQYEAIVWGHPEPPEGRIEAHLGRDPRDRKKMAVVKPEKGKPAATRYETLELFNYTARLAFRLETGRTHQIRVHARFLGHPLIGDETYGGTRILKGADTARRRAYWRNIFETLPRQALHARTLGFRHPATGKEMDFESELPADMTSVIERLRKGDPG